MKESGKKRFDNYFETQYGERWKRIRSALSAPRRYCSIRNNRAVFSIDAASYNAAMLLCSFIQKRKLHRVLDMCCAPGGKLIGILAHCNRVLELTANDKSAERLARARRNIAPFLSPQQRQSCRFTCRDAALFGKHDKEHYDLVLLDAPCSNDRLVYRSTQELERWNSRRCTRSSLLQRTLLCAAIDACRTGGVVAYITCSLSNEENDCLIERILKKRHVRPLPIVTLLQDAEEAKFGALTVPDTACGAGPLYVSILEKTAGGRT